MVYGSFMYRVMKLTSSIIRTLSIVSAAGVSAQNAPDGDVRIAVNRDIIKNITLVIGG
jgi:hypothetical protein